MHRVLISALMIFLVFGFAITEASAGRFGGGRGFSSMRSSMFSSSRASHNTYQKSATAKTMPRPRMGGMLTGLLAGGLLASLLMGNGLGHAFLSWLMLGFVVQAIARFIKRRKNN